jgi:Kdo2-lipid IVA lauroyltransferase/acyltransferase
MSDIMQRIPTWVATSTGKGPSEESVWRGIGQAAEILAAIAGLGLLSRLPVTQASNLMGALFRHVRPLLPVTCVAEANLKAVFPEWDTQTRRRVVHNMWENLDHILGELPRLVDVPKGSLTGPGREVVNDRILIEQAARGGPAIFVSGHIANWEILPPAVAAYGLPVSERLSPGKEHHGRSDHR